MQTSSEGVAEIAGHEGIVLSPYRDSVGVWTFGVGHTASAGLPDPAAMAKGVAQPLAPALDVFRRDLKHFEDRVKAAVKVPLEQHEFDALVSFDFNTGGILRARLTRLLNAGDREGAIAAFDGWHRPPEIIPRRDKEKRLFRDGVYANRGMATIFTADAEGRVAWSGGTRINALALLSPKVAVTDWVAQPDDPGPDPDPEPEEGKADMGAVAAGGAGFLALLALLGKLALWAALVAAVAGAGFLAWRYRDRLKAFFRRFSGRAA